MEEKKNILKNDIKGKKIFVFTTLQTFWSISSNLKKVGNFQFAKNILETREKIRLQNKYFFLVGYSFRGNKVRLC